MRIVLISIVALLFQAYTMGGAISGEPGEEQIPSTEEIAREQAYESEQTPEEIMDELLSGYDFTELNRQLHQIGGLETYNFEDLLELLMQGDVGVNSDNIDGIGQLLYQVFLSELNMNRGLMLKMIGLAIFMAVFTNLSSNSVKGTVSENGFYVTYLVMTILFLAAYQTMYELAYSAFQDLQMIMYALIPVYMAAVGFSSGITSAAVMEDSLLLGLSMISKAVQTWIFPMIHVYFALGLTDQLMKREFFSQLSELLKSAVSWLLKSILAITVGINTIKSMLAPAVDSVTAAALQRGLKIIPGGDTASMVSGVVIGSGVLIKNAIGGGGICVLVFAISVPVMKLTAIVLLYKMLEAVLQPIADPRMIKGLKVVDQSGQMLLTVLLTEISLFLLSIAIVANHTNMNYYAG